MPHIHFMFVKNDTEHVIIPHSDDSKFAQRFIFDQFNQGQK